MSKNHRDNDLAISQQKATIQELKLNKKSLFEQDEKLRKEAKLTIKKAEEIQRQNVEVTKLTDEDKLLDTKLAHSKRNLDKLRIEFKI